MTRPIPTTAAPVLFAIRLPREGWTMDRNGQLHVFNSHADALIAAGWRRDSDTLVEAGKICRRISLTDCDTESERVGALKCAFAVQEAANALRWKP